MLERGYIFLSPGSERLQLNFFRREKVSAVSLDVFFVFGDGTHAAPVASPRGTRTMRFLRPVSGAHFFAFK